MTQGEFVMTQQEVAQAIQKILDQAGYDLHLGIVLAKGGLNVTELVAEQFDLIPAAQLVKRPELTRAEFKE